jgi:hypothetical protein
MNAVQPSFYPALAEDRATGSSMLELLTTLPIYVRMKPPVLLPVIYSFINLMRVSPKVK